MAAMLKLSLLSLATLRCIKSLLSVEMRTAVDCQALIATSRSTSKLYLADVQKMLHLCSQIRLIMEVVVKTTLAEMEKVIETGTLQSLTEIDTCNSNSPNTSSELMVSETKHCWNKNCIDDQLARLNNNIFAVTLIIGNK